MSCYEIITTAISILSLLATSFFGYQVYKLSKQANDIAKESNDLQKKIIASSVDQRETFVKEGLSDTNHKNIDEVNKVNKILKQNLLSYNESMNRLKVEEHNKWKQKNNKLKKEFLNKKK